jgi:hypothetical protein
MKNPWRNPRLTTGWPLDRKEGCMLRRARLSGFCALVVLALVGLSVPVPSFAAECGCWNNVHVVHHPNGTAYCGDSGGSCCECTALYGGGGTTCVQDSYGDSVCYDFQSMPWD